MVRSCCCVVLLAACDFSSRTSGASDATRDGTLADAAADGSGAGCMARWHAGTVTLAAPVAIAELDTPADERDPFLSRDHLTIYFLSDRPGSAGHDVWMATRSDPSASFGSITLVPGINSAAFDSKLTTSADGLVGIFPSDRGNGQYAADLYLTSRAAVADNFGTPSTALTAALNTGDAAWDASLSDDGLRVYFESGTLQVASRANRLAAFSSPTPLANVNTGTELDPGISADERILLFARSGGVSRDLYYARRDRVSDPFTNIAPVPTINTLANEGDPFLTADGCRLYFAANQDLFYADVQ